MIELEQKILNEGIVLPGNVLKVGSFLNQQLDVDFLMKLGEEINRIYKNDGVTKLLTVESSGIAVAVAAGAVMHLPVVFHFKRSRLRIMTLEFHRRLLKVVLLWSLRMHYYWQSILLSH